MKKLILLLLVMPFVFLACEKQSERTTVTENEKERMKQFVVEHWNARCFRHGIGRMVDCEYFHMTDFRIIRTSFEDWEFYSFFNEDGLLTDEDRNRIIADFTTKLFSVKVFCCERGRSSNLYFNRRLVFLSGILLGVYDYFD